MRMLRLQNETQVVFFPMNAMVWAKGFRHAWPEFKRRRIVDVLQLKPSVVT